MLLPENVHFRTCLPGSCSRKSENMVTTDPLCISRSGAATTPSSNTTRRSNMNWHTVKGGAGYVILLLMLNAPIEKSKIFSTSIMPKPSTDMHTVKGEQDTSSPAIGNP